MEVIMKTTRIIALVAAVLMMLTALTGCFAPQEKKFSKAGMTITLDTSFYEDELVSQTAVYTSKNILVTALKEEFSLFESVGLDAGDFTVRDYAELVIENNLLTDTEVEINDGLTGFVFENEANGKTFKYSSYVFKGTDSFWLIQIAVEAGSYEKYAEQIKTIAKSVVVD